MNMKPPDSNIVADGARRLREAANARAVRRQLFEEITLGEYVEFLTLPAYNRID